MFRLAFIIMAYKEPKQLERMIYSLKGLDVDFYIHLDKKINIESFIYLDKIENVFFIKKRIKINWGTYSLTKGILSSLDEIRSIKISYSFYGIISGQDYPINPIENLYQFLRNDPTVNLIQFLPQGDPWYKEMESRIHNYSTNELNIIGKYKLELFLNTLFKKYRYKYPVKIYGGPGASFMILSHDTAYYIVRFLKKERKLRFQLELTWGPDEFIFQTIIMNSPYREHVKENLLYYVNWESGGLHPKIFQNEDLVELIEKSQFLARKFDINLDDKIFDLLDKRNKAIINQNVLFN